MKVVFSFLLLSILTLARSQESDWHMITGGWNDDFMEGLASVELFNWKTGEQCLLEHELPIQLSAHVGAILDTTPIICGGFSDYRPQDECYQFEEGYWFRSQTLLEPTYFGASVVVGSMGWYIFGGNSLQTSQHMKNLNSRWTKGPEMFQGENEIGQCIVQVDDTTTIFLGGSNDPYTIVSLDWNSLSYTKHEASLNGQRSQSACALVKDDNGDPLVAVAGGRNPGSNGLEVFNPKDGTVTVLSETLPQEDVTGSHLQNSHMMSVNGGTELLIYGGYDGVSTQDAIWKYSLPEKAWTYVGRMIIPRDDHFVLPVGPGVTC